MEMRFVQWGLSPCMYNADRPIMVFQSRIAKYFTVLLHYLNRGSTLSKLPHESILFDFESCSEGAYDRSSVIIDHELEILLGQGEVECAFHCIEFFLYRVLC